MGYTMNNLLKMSTEEFIMTMKRHWPSVYEAILFYVDNCESQNAPYHNFEHTMSVARFCYILGLEESDLDKEELEVLLIAAVFHDYNHLAGKQKSDGQNIERALEGLDTFSKERPTPNLQNARKIIQATEYPYVVEIDKIEDSFIKLASEIIRDADMMQIYSTPYQLMIINLLMGELGMSHEDALNGELRFLEGLVWHTETAPKIAEKFENRTESFATFVSELIDRK